MATISSLSVRVTAQTERAEDALDDLQEEALELSVAFESAAQGARSAEDEIEEAGDKATTSAGQFSGASLSLFGLSISAKTAAISLFGLGAALTAVLTAAIGLLGILAAVGGAFGLLAVAGVVGNLSELQNAFKETIPLIKNALQPLADVLGPLFIRAIRALPKLIDRIVNAVGGTEAFAQAAEELGKTLFNIIPPLVGLMFDIAREALPVIQRIFSRLQGTGGDVFGVIAESTRKLLPSLIQLAGAVGAFLPEFIKFGTTVAQVVIPALSLLFATLTPLLQAFNSLPGPVKRLTIGVVALSLATSGSLIPSLGFAAGALYGLATAVWASLGPLSLLAIAIGALGAAFATNFMGIRDAVVGALSTVRDWINMAIGLVGDFSNSLNDLGSSIANLPGIKQVLDVTTGGGGGGGTNVNIGQINASGRREGRRAGRGVMDQLSGNTRDTSRSL